MDDIKLGDLVKDADGHYGIVMELGDELLVFSGNGLPCIEQADQLERVLLPNSTAPCNFLEILAPLASGIRVRVMRRKRRPKFKWDRVPGEGVGESEFG